MGWFDDPVAQQSGGCLLNSLYPSPPRGRADPVRAAPPLNLAGPPAQGASPEQLARAALASGLAAGMNGNDEISRATAWTQSNEADQAQQAREVAAARLGMGWRTPQPAMPSEGATANNIVRSAGTGVPIIGGVLNEMNAATNATLAPVLNPWFVPEDQLSEPTWGGRFAHSLRDQQDADARFSQQHPYMDAAARSAGGMTSPGAVAKSVPLVGWALGDFGGPLAERIVRGVGARAGIGGIDAAVRGEDTGDGARHGAAFGWVRPARRAWLGF